MMHQFLIVNPQSTAMPDSGSTPPIALTEEVAPMIDAALTRSRIEARLETLGLTMNAAAEMADFDRTLLRKFLRGDVQKLGDDKIVSLAKVLGVSAPFLRGETDAPEPEAALTRANLDVPVIGYAEADALRPADYFDGRDLGVVTGGYDPTFVGEQQFAWLVRGTHAAGLGLSDGHAAVCVDPWKPGLGLADGDLVVVAYQEGNRIEWTVREFSVQRDHYTLTMKPLGEPASSVRVPVTADLAQGREYRIVGRLVTIMRRLPGRLPARMPSSTPQKTRSASGSERAGLLVGGLGSSALVTLYEAFVHAHGWIDYVLA